MERGKLFEKRRMGLTAWNTGDIVKRQTVSKDGGLGVRTVGHIDMEKFRCITDEITTDEVVITDTQIQHIQERHPGVWELLGKYFDKIVQEPDYILEANKPCTALILKEIKQEKIKLVLRLITLTDHPKYKNSIITCIKIDDKEWLRLLRNKKILYKRE